jgi:hypothetical protein
MAQLRTTVRTCPRCGKDHVDLALRPLANAADKYGWWAECPISGEPLWFTVEEIQQ